jgi:formate-dependent nitrite reductase cytochrome c552 subunit
MNTDAKTPVVLAMFAIVFLALASAFRASLWGGPDRLPSIPLVDPEFTNTMTVRLSAAELIATGGDTSGMDCYACHDKAKPVVVKIDTNNNVILPKEHEDLVLKHGRNNRNNHCYNCHDPANLDHLLTRDGHQLELKDSPRLCGSCHGPTYRDWEVGIHGRTSGYWNRQMGEISRKNCTSCHDPHAPRFPPLKPAPGPHALHDVHPSPPITKEGTH